MASSMSELPAEVEQFVSERIASGRYANAAQVLSAAKDALIREEHQQEAQLSKLRDALQAGLDSGIAEDGVFDRVRQRAGLSPKAAA